MIVLRRLLPTDINIVIEVSGTIYICTNRISAIGSTFIMGSTVVYPTYQSDANFANEILIYIYENNNTIIDDRGNTYQEVHTIYENTNLNIPTR